MTIPLPTTVQTLKALAHPCRLRLAAVLRGGPLCVCQLTEIAGVAASTVSEHLAELRRAGVVRERRSGRWVTYELASPPSPTVAAALATLAGDTTIRDDAERAAELRRIGPEELCAAAAESAAAPLTARGGRR